MRDQPAPDVVRGAQVPLGTPATPGSPSSSRMFAGYLSDIEQLLDEERWEAAQREAFDLPCVTVALADARLRCSPELVKTWCQEWIRPPGAERDAQGLDFEALGQRITERAVQLAGAEVVPMRALRRLQLRRHVRRLPRGFSHWRADSLPAPASETAETCSALLQAARRWYARSACHDPIVQANLARLAVLR